MEHWADTTVGSKLRKKINTAHVQKAHYPRQVWFQKIQIQNHSHAIVIISLPPPPCLQGICHFKMTIEDVEFPVECSSQNVVMPFALCLSLKWLRGAWHQCIFWCIMQLYNGIYLFNSVLVGFNIMFRRVLGLTNWHNGQAFQESGYFQNLSLKGRLNTSVQRIKLPCLL